MTDEELMARLRLLNEVDANAAADRIEALVKERDDGRNKLHKMHRRAQLAEGKNIRSARMLNDASNIRQKEMDRYWSFYKSKVDRADRAEARAKSAEVKLAKAVDALHFYADLFKIPKERPWGPEGTDFVKRIFANITELEAKP
jgi:hypothetical protein